MRSSRFPGGEKKYGGHRGRTPVVRHQKLTWPFGSSYLTSTFAPASSNFFLIVAASSLVTPSLMGLGAPSTRSLASLRPRLVTSRTTLITLILLPPTSVSVTVNSVCSSAAAAPAAGAPPPMAIAIG